MSHHVNSGLLSSLLTPGEMSGSFVSREMYGNLSVILWEIAGL